MERAPPGPSELPPAPKSGKIKVETPGLTTRRVGADRIRTDGLLRAREALFQLSYCPVGEYYN
jgi:hypothetical protein